MGGREERWGGFVREKGEIDGFVREKGGEVIVEFI